MDIASPYAAALERVPTAAHVTSTAGADTAWWEYGDPTAATTIVMVHGFRGDHHGLEPFVAQLHGVRIVIPDLPGFGRSAAPMGMLDIDVYAGWLRRFVATLKVTGRLVVLGHSFGSIVVAAAVAGGTRDAGERDAGGVALSPERVVLVNPIGAPALAGPRGLMTRLAVFYYWLGARLPKRLGFALLRNGAIVRVMSIAMAKTHEKARRRWIHDQHDRYFSAFDDRRVVLEAFHASVENDVTLFAARIRQPTLLIAADKDDITPLAAQCRLQTLFPDARLVVLEGVGHLVHYEAPEQAAAAITAFLTEPAEEQSAGEQQ